MKDFDLNSEDDFELELFPAPSVLEDQRRRRREVAMPQGVPGVEEVLLTPGGRGPRVDTARVERLMRVQLRRAILTLATFFGLIVVTNVVFFVVPAVEDARIFGLPLWWALPPLVFTPLLVLLGEIYLRRATATERNMMAEYPRRRP